jgi:ABC-2 type transport system permease protein
MSNLIALVKVELKNYMANTNANLGVGNKKILVFLLLGLLAFSFFVMGYQLSVSLFTGFEQINQSELTFTVIYLLANMLILFLSLTALINLFYYSKNTGFLLTLPIKENTIIFSRLAVQYVYSFVMSAMFLIPCYVVYFQRASFTIPMLVSAIVLLLITPLIPLVLATILIVIIMSFANKYISRRMMTIITNVLLLVFILGFQMIVVRQTESSSFILDLLLSESGMLYYFSLQFPPAVLATRAFAGGMINLILFIGLNIGLVALASVIIGPAVKRTLREYQQGEGKVKVKQAKYVESSQLSVLIKRNLLIIFKNPAFLMNMLILILLPFIMVGINMISGQFSFADMKSMIEEIGTQEFSGILTVILAGLLAAPAFMGTFSATAITREGRYLWQLKSMPISAELDLKARLMSCFIMSMIGIIVILPFAIYLLPISIIEVVLAVVLAVVSIVTMLNIDILIDIERPLLNWTSPTQAIKNNLNIMLALAWRIGVILLVFMISKLLPVINAENIQYVLLGIMLILLVISYKLYQKGIKRYEKLEI